MDIDRLERLAEFAWRIAPAKSMRVPVVIYADEELILTMDDKVCEQAMNVASLPGIVDACYAMPDAHWGYGFPIGGVAAFDPERGGVISAGGVGFDISCGVRTLLTGLKREEVEPIKNTLAEALYSFIPAGVGSRGSIRLDKKAMDEMLLGGAAWAVGRGYGTAQDLTRIEEQGRMAQAMPGEVSDHAKERQREEMGTLGSGNHYLEVQEVAEIFDAETAAVFNLATGDVVVSIHCGSRGLGHQIGTDFLRHMQIAAAQHGIALPDRELACAPLASPVGQSYLGAMRAAINCALANRQILTHLTRQVFANILPKAHLEPLYDVSHNTCKLEEHRIDGKPQRVYVHRKGATRAFGSDHPELPAVFQNTGQPVLIGGSMGTSSYILAGNPGNEQRAFASACHGAGRSMSRHQATKTWRGRQVIDELAGRGIIVRSPSQRGVAEEAPGAYKNVDAVVRAADRAGLARLVARLKPMVCIKG
ncbi:MAG: RtcB family protein [Methylococcaceae bacterium]|nr:RtcB family protein [Methylococcaceae bacterium]